MLGQERDIYRIKTLHSFAVFVPARQAVWKFFGQSDDLFVKIFMDGRQNGIPAW